MTKLRALLGKATRPGVLRALRNVAWLSADRVLRILVGIVVTAWVARHLGPEGFGKLSFAAAAVAIFAVLASLGLDTVLVRDLVKYPDRRHELLGSALCIRLVGAMLGIVGALLFAWTHRSADTTSAVLISILTFGLLSRCVDVIELWLQATLQNRLSVLAKNGAFLVGALCRVALIAGDASVVMFAWVALFELLLGAIGLVVVYRLQDEKLALWRCTYDCAIGLLRSSLPLACASLAIAVYTRIDQIMISNMVGDSATGAYAAAVRILEALFFVPMVLVASLLPAIVSSKSADERLFAERIQQLLDLIVLAALSIAVPLSVLAPLVVDTLYGEQYASAASVLAIQAWACVFVFLGVASSSYLVAENLVFLSLYRTIIGACANVALNLTLIPNYGIVGAACASLASYAVSTFALAAFPSGRPIALMMLRALVPLHLLRRKHAT